MIVKKKSQDKIKDAVLILNGIFKLTNIEMELMVKLLKKEELKATQAIRNTLTNIRKKGALIKREPHVFYTALSNGKLTIELHEIQ